MKRALLFLAISSFCMTGFTMTVSSHSNHTLAHSLAKAFKNHTAIGNKTQQAIATTTYGGADVSNQPLRAIA